MCTKVSRLTKKTLFSVDNFYIYEYDRVWHFRDTRTHMVVSNSNTLEGLIDKIYIILDRYKTYDLYLKAISRMSESGVTPIQREAREKEYKKNGDKHYDLLKDIIRVHNNKVEETITKTRVKRVVPIEDSKKPSIPEVVSPVPVIQDRKSIRKRKSRL